MSTKKSLSDKNIAIGTRIREIRGNLSQAEFGRLLGVQAAAVSKYEKGRIPDLSTLEKIAALAQKPIEWLLTGIDKMAIGHLESFSEPEALFSSSAPYLIRDLLEEIITAVERRLAKKKQALSPSRKAFVIVNLYDELFGSDQDLTPELVDHHIKAVS